MRLLKSFAFGLVLCSSLTWQAIAIESDQAIVLESDEVLPQVAPADPIAAEVQRRLAEPFRSNAQAEKAERGALVEFYAEHGPLWVDEKGLTERGQAVIAEIERAGDFGLNPSDYHLPGAVSLAEDKTVADRLAEAELLLSRAMLSYARHAQGGRVDPAAISEYFDPPLTFDEPFEVVRAIAASDDPAAYLRGLHPQHPQFEALRQALIEARGAKGERKPVKVPDGPILRRGDRHPHVAILRQRLDVDAGADEAANNLFDEKVDQAVRAFQQAKGLQVDGVVGPATRRAFAAAPTNRVNTILVNMERWRWLPQDLGGFHVRVNIPEFQFRVVDNGEAIHSERVIVGKTTNQTPIFSEKMTYLDFNPYWHIPDSIKVEQILPELVRDTRRYAQRGWGPWDNRGDSWGRGGYWDSRGGGFFRSSPRRNVVPEVIARRNLRIHRNGQPVDAAMVDWTRADIRQFHIFQPPGPPNVLGAVKFMFPNKHDVYMHDTPERNLFNSGTRAYSFGCVRVRDPLRFAEILLSRDQGWSMGNVQRTIDTAELQTINLQRPVPVHMTYFTAQADSAGKIQYFSDVYGHDRRMAAALKL